MTVGISATIIVKADKASEFEKIFTELMAVVADKEPGNNYYDLYRSRDEENTYFVMEQYVDQAAVDLHGKSDEFKAVGARLGGCLAGAPTVKLCDSI